MLHQEKNLINTEECKECKALHHIDSHTQPCDGQHDVSINIKFLIDYPFGGLVHQNTRQNPNDENWH